MWINSESFNRCGCGYKKTMVKSWFALIVYLLLVSCHHTMYMTKSDCELLLMLEFLFRTHYFLNNIGYIYFMWERTTDWWQFIVPISLNKQVSLGLDSAACHVQRRISREYFPKHPNKFIVVKTMVYNSACVFEFIVQKETMILQVDSHDSLVM